MSQYISVNEIVKGRHKTKKGNCKVLPRNDLLHVICTQLYMCVRCCLYSNALCRECNTSVRLILEYMHFIVSNGKYNWTIPRMHLTWMSISSLQVTTKLSYIGLIKKCDKHVNNSWDMHQGQIRFCLCLSSLALYIVIKFLVSVIFLHSSP